MQEFDFGKKFPLIMKGCIILFIACLVFVIALLFFSDETKENYKIIFFLKIAVAAILVFLIISSWLTLQRLPYLAIVIDDDGIWHKHLEKSQGIIPWERIAKIKERAYLQRLNILAANGDVLLRVEYQLVGFEDLRDILNEKVIASRDELKCFSFSKGPFYHAFYLVKIIGLFALGLYLGANGNPLLGYGGMSAAVIFITCQYLMTAARINLTNNALEIIYPINKKNVHFSEIKSIKIIDKFRDGSRIPEIWIISKKSKSPFKLKELGVDSNVLYKALRRAAKI